MRRRATQLLWWSLLVCAILIAVGLFVPTRAAEPTLDQLIPPDTGYHDAQYSGIWSILVHRVVLQPFHLISLIIFVCAIIHTFCASWFTRLAKRLEERYAHNLAVKGITYDPKKHITFLVELFQFLGEVEVVFGLWVIPLTISIGLWFDWETAIFYLSTRDFREPMLVIVIMTIASTRPVLRIAEDCIHFFARWGKDTPGAQWLSLLTVGPFLGSIITEPGAMTITAALLGRQFFVLRPKRILAYATLGLLFVNISTGGDLTHFAAPPVLIVARKWDWSTPFMFTHFGWKSIIGVAVSNLLYWFIFRKEFARLKEVQKIEKMAEVAVRHYERKPIPVWVTVVHLAAIGWIVLAGHTPVIFIGVFLLFLAFYQATLPHQSPLNLRSSLLVGLFLMGLVIHGGLQGWWISPFLANLTALPLMFLSIGLTSINDNASITYLSSLSPFLTNAQKYAVVAGAISGGGLTVIANAPNPAGQQILSRYFPLGVSPWRLFLGALIPTIIVALAFIFLDFGYMFPQG